MEKKYEVFEWNIHGCNSDFSINKPVAIYKGEWLLKAIIIIIKAKLRNAGYIKFEIRK